MNRRPLFRNQKLEVVNYFFNHDCSYKLTAEAFDISEGSVYRYVREYKETGDLREPLTTISGRPDRNRGAVKPKVEKKHLSTNVVPCVADHFKANADKHNMTVSEYLRRLLTAIYKKQRCEK